MAIDTSGRWWRGDGAADIEEYLAAYSAETYPTKYYRPSRCECGCIEFRLEKDAADETRRTCARCGALRYMADSEEYWEGDEVTAWKCVECESSLCNVGVGYAGYEDDPTGIKWIYVGERCSTCGVLGCFAERKIALGDALYLLDKA